MEKDALVKLRNQAAGSPPAPKSLRHRGRPTRHVSHGGAARLCLPLCHASRRRCVPLRRAPQLAPMLSAAGQLNSRRYSPPRFYMGVLHSRLVYRTDLLAIPAPYTHPAVPYECRFLPRSNSAAVCPSTRVGSADPRPRPPGDLQLRPIGGSVMAIPWLCRSDLQYRTSRQRKSSTQMSAPSRCRVRRPSYR